MTNKKGAFQLSLGLIVIVVFAVVLLSLSLGWLQDMFQGFGDITHKVQEQAIQDVLQQIESSGATVGLAAPAVTTWKKGETGSYALIIRNDNDVSSQTYVINLYLEQLGGNLAGRTVSSYSDDVAAWLTYSPTEVLQADERKSVNIIIKPAAGSASGIYLIRAAVCTGSGVCKIDSGTLYGTKTFAIEIE
ncbi:MAG: hypothetical protein ABIH52_03320 [Candidatus Aenigmatarchaeota archaeon]